MKKSKTQKGITLVALIITIIILLILAVVAISSITGDGILQKAREASDATARAQIQEELDLVISNLMIEESMRNNMNQQEKAEWLRQELNKQDGNATVVESGNGFIGNYKDHNFSITEDYKVTIGDYAQNDNNSNNNSSNENNNEDNSSEENNNNDNSNNENSGENNNDNTNNDNSQVENPDTNPKEPISTSESYVGYYADIDANGTVDGIIYADLAIGGSGQWTDSNGNYKINKKANLNNYYISKADYETNGFGTKAVISPIDTIEENDRFYVMSLTDFNTGSRYCWYADAYNNMSDYNSATSGEFGTGKTNTKTMIEKWNNKAYGEHDKGGSLYKDLWGQIQTQVENGWFVPSRGEWSAFGKGLGITVGTYANYGLSPYYWSSSQIDEFSAWYVHCYQANMAGSGNYVLVATGERGYVRLSTTF